MFRRRFSHRNRPHPIGLFRPATLAFVAWRSLIPDGGKGSSAAERQSQRDAISPVSRKARHRLRILTREKDALGSMWSVNPWQ